MATPTENEINEVLDQCMDSEDTGVSIFPGMNYEQGVKAAIDWIQGDSGHPFED